jgi:hypothetical protein
MLAKPRGYWRLRPFPLAADWIFSFEIALFAMDEWAVVSSEAGSRTAVAAWTRDVACEEAGSSVAVAARTRAVASEEVGSVAAAAARTPDVAWAEVGSVAAAAARTPDVVWVEAGSVAAAAARAPDVAWAEVGSVAAAAARTPDVACDEAGSRAGSPRARIGVTAACANLISLKGWAASRVSPPRYADADRAPWEPTYPMTPIKVSKAGRCIAINLQEKPPERGVP